MVNINKFWIEGVLLAKYPQFLKNSGADLDGNGVIEGNEVFGDINKDGTIDRGDYREYLCRNRDVLAKQTPFFKWGQRLSVNNRIHQLLYLESDLYPDSMVESAYQFIVGLVGDVGGEVGKRRLSPQEEGTIYYSAMLAVGRGVYLQTLNDQQLEGFFLTNRGVVLRRLGRYAEASKAYEEACRLDSKLCQ